MKIQDARAKVTAMLFGPERVAEVLQLLAELEQERHVAQLEQRELSERLEALRKRSPVAASEFARLDAQHRAAVDRVSELARALDHLRMVCDGLQLPLHQVPRLEVVEATELVPGDALPILEQLRRCKAQRWQAQVAVWRAEDAFEAGQAPRQVLDEARVALAAAAAAFDASMNLAKALGFDTSRAHVDASGAFALRMPTKEEWRAAEAARKEPTP